MDIASLPASKISQMYQTQNRIAELNKKANIKSIQGQVDRVTISAEAHQMIGSKNSPKEKSMVG